MKLLKGTKLVSVSKYNKWDMRIDFIKTVNEKSYSLEQGLKIDKKTMINKWKQGYMIPTQEQLEFIDKNNKKEILTKIVREFNDEMNDTISILETVEKYNNLLELSLDTIKNIEDCISNLKEELEETK